MDEQDFRSYLKRSGKKPHVIEGLVQQVKLFEGFLSEHGRKGLDSADPDDIRGYAARLEALKPGSSGKGVRGLALYFRHVNSMLLARTASGLREKAVASSRKSFPIQNFGGIPAQYINTLQAAGITTTEQMLEAGKDPASRLDLAGKTGLPLDVIMQVVKLSDLSRIHGIKGVRARLYYDAGVDTLEKMAAQTEEGLSQLTKEFIGRTGFEGIAPLPKEIRFTIEQAKKVTRIVTF